jgi:hypothetical protein
MAQYVAKINVNSKARLTCPVANVSISTFCMAFSAMSRKIAGYIDCAHSIAVLVFVPDDVQTNRQGGGWLTR